MAGPRTEVARLIRVHPRAHRKLQRGDWRGYPTDGQGPWMHPDLLGPAPPAITATLRTQSGPVGVTGQITIDITGTPVSGTAKVEFNGTIHANTTVTNGGLVVNAASITLPATPGPYNVVVVDGTKRSNVMTFYATGAAPTASSVSPTSALWGATVGTVTLNGANFRAGAVLLVAGPAPYNIKEFPATLTGSTQARATNVPMPTSGFQCNVWLRNTDNTDTAGTVQTIAISQSGLERIVVLPGEYSIPTIKEWVDDNPEFADELLASEQRDPNTARATLVAWLEGFIEHRDE